MKIKGAPFQLNPPFIVGGRGVGMWIVTNHEHRCSMELLIRKNFFLSALDSIQPGFKGLCECLPPKGTWIRPKRSVSHLLDLSLGTYHKSLWQFWRWNRNSWRLTASVMVGVEETCFCDEYICGGGCKRMRHEKRHCDTCLCPESGDGEKDCITSEFP